MIRYRETDPRKAALTFFLRYWGLDVMHKEKARAHLPVLDFEEDEWEPEEPQGLLELL